jgi:hypothetical protein
MTDQAEKTWNINEGLPPPGHGKMLPPSGLPNQVRA